MQVRSIKDETISLYPEVDFKNFDYPNEFGTVNYPSKLSKGIDTSKSLKKVVVLRHLLSVLTMTRNSSWVIF